MHAKGADWQQNVYIFLQMTMVAWCITDRSSRYKTRQKRKRRTKTGGDGRTLVYRILLEESLEAERLERNPIANEMFAHGFDPVQTEGVQHGASSLHDAQDAHGQDEPEVESEHNHHDLDTGWWLGLERAPKGHVPKDDGKLLVSERQSPKTKIRRSVRNAIKTEL